MPKTKLTERTIQGLTSGESFQRGKAYFRDGAVSSLVLRADTLTADVEGSEYDPYKVTIKLHDGGVADADCGCPYDWGGYCKHIVAVLLAYQGDPETVNSRPPVSELLESLDRDQLLALLKKRLDEDSRFADWIETQATVIQTYDASSDGDGTSPQRRTLVDSEPFRRQAQNLLRSPGRRRHYWDDYNYNGNTEELQRLVESAVPFLEAGDGRNALRILEPITDTFLEEWTHNHSWHDEDMYMMFADLGNLFAEAILSSDLTNDELEDWITTMSGWQETLEDYGVDDGFWVAIGAAVQGWDDPELQGVLDGKSNDRNWATDDRWEDDQLIAARLRVLERSGQADKYLRLALVTGHLVEYAIMLVRLDRVDEAVLFGATKLETPNEALALAKALQEHDKPEEALTVAEAGLGLVGAKDDDYHTSAVSLGRWLRDFAGGLGRGDIALKAAKVAFIESLELDDYKAVEVHSEKAWPQIKPELLDHLATAKHAFERTEIYLYEGMVDAAVKSIGDDVDYYGRSDVLMRVADAAYESHPDWVIKRCRKEAEEIMDGGHSQHYDRAAQWLERVKKAYLASDRAGAWDGLITSLISKHVRKYKMKPLLEKLR